MACNCNRGNSTARFEHTKPNGEKTQYKSEVQAQAARIKFGGSYRKITG